MQIYTDGSTVDVKVAAAAKCRHVRLVNSLVLKCASFDCSFDTPVLRNSQLISNLSHILCRHLTSTK